LTDKSLQKERKKKKTTVGNFLFFLSPSVSFVISCGIAMAPKKRKAGDDGGASLGGQPKLSFGPKPAAKVVVEVLPEVEIHVMKKHQNPDIQVKDAPVTVAVAVSVAEVKEKPQKAKVESVKRPKMSEKERIKTELERIQGLERTAVKTTTMVTSEVHHRDDLPSNRTSLGAEDAKSGDLGIK
jgi:hypothetical protein